MTTGTQSPLDRRPTLALVDRRTRAANPGGLAALEARGVTVRDVDYDRLMDHVDELRQVIRERGIDFVLFSQNDQVFEYRAIGELIRALRVGYSSFSGLDTDSALEQSRECLADLLDGPRPLNLPPPVSPTSVASGGAGTFSLVFDLEQLGCARVGLPRILALLDELGVRATFFATGFALEVFPDVLPALLSRGHEVGWHGAYHEYLAGQTLENQIALLATLKEIETAASPIRGANFIGRMDEVSIEAMIASGLEYFVEMREHRYRPFGYAPVSSQPELIRASQGSIWSVPISVETNNRPWPIVRGMIDSAISTGVVDRCHHLNILLHPFRDGSLRHIGDLRRLVQHLVRKHQYRGVPVSEFVSSLAGRDAPHVRGRNGEGEAVSTSSRWGARTLQRPRTRHDVLGFLPEAALRAAYRMAPGRHPF